ncbi:hypothetical protein O7626_40235 [Micromonospora sp. WMMD1102]|uniref:hypothetical protein n=1 Tax=Micromonospora sp. WMMD1102 TaxID=3016105 RepID=UPI002414E633|nr:hypothetical protein [Micromonospora sp. WMMD1102]MDG4792047.1 hypothetical protein [Micromonospora sp. WMMD1102]
MVSPERILRQREVTAMAALDTMPHLTARVRNLLAHGRRMTVTQRYTYLDQPPEVTAGLTLDTQARGGDIVEGVKPDEFHHFGVHLRPGLLAGFGFSAYASEGNTTEAEAWKRYHAGKDAVDRWKRRRRMTLIEIVGGLPGDGPARGDQLVIRAWNDDGVCDERVVAFDYGPDRQQQRDNLARHLWTADAGSPDRWDSFTLDDGARVPFYTRADELLAVIAGTDG